MFRRWIPGAGLLGAVLLGGVVGGCGLLGERYPDAETLRAQGRAEAQSGYAYGHGTGERPEAARQSALYELAGEVVTAVRGEQQEVFRSLERRGEVGSREVEQATELELTSTVASLTQVALEGASVEAEQRTDQGWYVRVRLPQSRMDELRARARRHAPAIAQFELTEAVPETEPGRLFARAAQGGETVARLGLGEERVYSPRFGEMTFAAYFEHAARRAVERLQLIPVVSGRRIRFVAVDRESLRPQPHLRLRIDGLTHITDDSGWTGERSVRGLREQLPVEVLGTAQRRFDRDPMLCCVLTPRGQVHDGRDRAVLYIHSRPPEAVVRVNGQVYRTPARIPVDAGREHYLRFPETSSYRGRSMGVYVDAQAPAAYRSVRLSERRQRSRED
ncbi:MAG: hypothetical protein ACOC1T_01615 [Halorhodospira sp.]